MDVEPVSGRALRFPPGRLAVKLTPAQAQAYRRLYGRYGSVLAGLPVLRERDLEGGPVALRLAEVDALNRAFASLEAPGVVAGEGAAFAAQERTKNRLFKRLQYLS